MGDGPQIILYDASIIGHTGLRDFVVDVADELEIPYQYDAIAGGGTDAGSIHITVNGVPAMQLRLRHATFILMQQFYIVMTMKMR